MVTYRKMDLEKADEIVILGEVIREVTFEQRPDGQGGQRDSWDQHNPGGGSRLAPQP